jgi:hypothetical protein
LNSGGDITHSELSGMGVLRSQTPNAPTLHMPEHDPVDEMVTEPKEFGLQNELDDARHQLRRARQVLEQHQQRSEILEHEARVEVLSMRQQQEQRDKTNSLLLNNELSQRRLGREASITI